MLLLILQTVAMAGAKPSTPHTYVHIDFSFAASCFTEFANGGNGWG